MKYFLSTLLVLCITLVQAQSKAELNAATVYLNGVDLQAKATGMLSSGSNTIRISGLPSMVDENSIRVSSTNGTVTGVNFKLIEDTDAQYPAALMDIYKELKEAEFKLNVRQAMLRVYQEEKALITANKTILGGDSKLLVEDLEALANTYRSRLKEVELKMLETKQEEKEYKEKVDRLKAVLGNQNPQQNSVKGELALTVYAQSGGAATFNISLFSQNAGWVPLYDVKAGTGNTVSLAYKAKIFQSTGVEWKNVKLSVSTGNPGITGIKPELRPEYVDFYQPRPQMANARYKSAKMEAMVVEDEAVAGNYQAVQRESLTNTFFDIPLPYSIPSNATGFAVEIKKENLSAEVQYHAIPKLNSKVYLVADIKGYQGLGLMSGEAAIYQGEDYIGKTYINPRNTEGLQVNLGVDKAITAEKKSLNNLSDDGGVLSGNKKTFHYKLVVKNNKSAAVKVKLQDQFPISRNSDITVDLDNISGANVNAETGMLDWNIDLQTGESKEFEVKYTIKFPKGREINR